MMDKLQKVIFFIKEYPPESPHIYALGPDGEDGMSILFLAKK